jgi:hypothetical protein
MRREFLTFTCLSIMCMVFTAAPVLAQSPHFVGTPTCQVTSSGGAVTATASGTVAGLGNATDFVTITGTANVTCTSRGKGGTQTTSAHQISGTSPVQSTSNGNFPFSTSASTSCPGSQTATFSGTSFQATLTLSSGPSGTGTVFDTATVTCQ